MTEKYTFTDNKIVEGVFSYTYGSFLFEVKMLGRKISNAKSFEQLGSSFINLTALVDDNQTLISQAKNIAINCYSRSESITTQKAVSSEGTRYDSSDKITNLTVKGIHASDGSRMSIRASHESEASQVDEALTTYDYYDIKIAYGNADSDKSFLSFHYNKPANTSGTSLGNYIFEGVISIDFEQDSGSIEIVADDGNGNLADFQFVLPYVK